ncbi:hypothetical protein LTR53_009378 [Teratosphaeriaceae sp. CCFEE 6253]|nr:hypothetical protein LTR53_009378 [Teratosphaeriaceae sp. CCFEE 6253]
MATPATTTTASTPAAPATPSRLLALPAELRNRIYRLVPLQPQNILVTVHGYDIPPLLSTCKEIRRDNISVFYCESTFIVQTKDYNVMPYVQVEQHLRRLSLSARETWSIKLYWRMTATQPVWRNLMHWLELYHRQQTLAGFPSPLRSLMLGGSAPWAAVGTLFECVGGLRDLPWSRVEKIALGMRPLLVKLDAGWT